LERPRISPIVRVIRSTAEELEKPKTRLPPQQLVDILSKFNYDSIPLLEELGYRDLIIEQFIPWTLVVLPAEGGEYEATLVSCNHASYIHNIAIAISDGGTGLGAFVHIEVSTVYPKARPWMLAGPPIMLRANEMLCEKNVRPCYTDFTYVSGSQGNYTILYQAHANPVKMSKPWVLRVVYPSQQYIQEVRAKLEASGKTDLASMADDALANWGKPVTIWFSAQYSEVNPVAWKRLFEEIAGAI